MSFETINKVKEYLSSLQRPFAEKADFQLDAKGRLSFNEYNEETDLKTEGFKIFRHNEFCDQETLIFYVLSDSHIGSEEAELNKIKRNLEYVKNNKNIALILNGDLINNALKDSVSDSYRQQYSILESIEIIKDLIKEIDEEGRIVANNWGNHDGDRSAKKVAITPVETYVKNSDITAPGVSIHIFTLKNKFDPTKPFLLKVMTQHGHCAKGGPLGTVQSGIELAKNIAGGMPDLVILGNTHQNAGGSEVIFTPDMSKTRKTKKKRLKAYAAPPGIPTELYAMQKGYKMASTDAYLIEPFQAKDDHNESFWDFHTIDLDKLYSIENLIKNNHLITLHKTQNILNREERKFTRKWEKINENSFNFTESQKIVYDYLYNLIETREKIVKEYQLEKFYNNSDNN